MTKNSSDNRQRAWQQPHYINILHMINYCAKVQKITIMVTHKNKTVWTLLKKESSCDYDWIHLIIIIIKRVRRGGKEKSVYMLIYKFDIKWLYIQIKVSYYLHLIYNKLIWHLTIKFNQQEKILFLHLQIS